jgi:hypothetical protein
MNFTSPISVDKRAADFTQQVGIDRMDRASLLDHSVRAEQHMVLAKRQVNDQYRIIAELERECRDTEEAIELLKQFIEAQELWERDRDRLMTKLATDR